MDRNGLFTSLALFSDQARAFFSKYLLTGLGPEDKINGPDRAQNLGVEHDSVRFVPKILVQCCQISLRLIQTHVWLTRITWQTDQCWRKTVLSVYHNRTLYIRTAQNSIWAQEPTENPR